MEVGAARSRCSRGSRVGSRWRRSPAARRTDSAFSRLLVATNAAHVMVNPDYGNDSGLDWKAVAKLPMVTEADARENGVIVVPLPVRGPSDLTGSLGLAQVGSAGRTVARLHVLHGHAPDPRDAHDVLVNPRFAARNGVTVGDTFPAVILEADKLPQAGGSGGTFDDLRTGINSGSFGDRVRLRVAGIAESPEEIVLDEGFEQSELIATPAFLRRHPQADAGFFGILTRLRRGAADIPAFKRAVQALPHQGAIEFQTTSATEAKVARAVRPQVGALSVFAMVIARTGLLLVGQALARQTFLDSVDHPDAARSGSAVASSSRSAGAACRGRGGRGGGPGGRYCGRGVPAHADRRRPRRRSRPRVLRRPTCDAARRAGRVRRRHRAGDAPRMVVHAWRYFWMADHPAAWTSRTLVGWLGWAGGRSPRDWRPHGTRAGRGRTAVPVRTTIVGAALAIATVVAALTFVVEPRSSRLDAAALYGWSWTPWVSAGGDTPGIRRGAARVSSPASWRTPSRCMHSPNR